MMSTQQAVLGRGTATAPLTRGSILGPFSWNSLRTIALAVHPSVAGSLSLLVFLMTYKRRVSQHVNFAENGNCLDPYEMTHLCSKLP
jgi:hypothetical protein